MKSEHLLVLGLVGIAVTTIVAIHFANKGAHVKLGPPFYRAEIN